MRSCSTAPARRIECPPHSVAAFVEREAGPRGKGVFGGRHLARELDPHATVEAARSRLATVP